MAIDGKRRSLMRGRPEAPCAHCDKTFGIFELTLDHIVPRVRGGRNRIENLALACRPCNGERGHIDFNHFRAWKRRQLGLPEIPALVFDQKRALKCVKWLRDDSTDTCLPPNLRTAGPVHNKKKCTARVDPVTKNVSISYEPVDMGSVADDNRSEREGPRRGGD